MTNNSSYPCLIFDLETLPPEAGKPERIFMIGALRPDTDAKMEERISNAADLAQALARLDEMTIGAAFVLGHNILAHDLQVLQRAAPGLLLHSLPVMDTLRLSPLAFPQNPYHRLIKDYKLIRASLNSPLGDCRSALTLFQDQHKAFLRLNETNRSELLCYQTLIAPTTESDPANFFKSLTGEAPLGPDKLRTLIPELLRESDPALERDLKVCRTRLAALIHVDLYNKSLHWPIAYALAWLRVSGGNSVLAPWVRHQFPEVGMLISELRDVPCGKTDCSYCRTTFDPRAELKRYFGFDDFRLEPSGESLQHDIVLSSMRGKNVMAVLATGGGKSLCYQLPALNRFHRNASLTIIVSPLQSLMKDQVDGLLDRNISCAATLNGLLTLPERSDVLEKIQMGDIGILLVSPEQFRNKAFRRAIAQREIGAWIFDEAHCLSVWGNDFRPDYLYVSRFIREYTKDKPLSPVGCFTATATPAVLDEILEHFKKNLGIAFGLFVGVNERENLSFDVLPCEGTEKWPRVHAVLTEEIGGVAGGAVVFVSTRKNAEVLSGFLKDRGWVCIYFHAGLAPHEKKDIQDAFKAGSIRVIVATNAFGMGVDKADIRVVIHADIPGSIENYLQEAGRAGRDQNDAKCVLLYDPQDIETRFGLTEQGRLTFRDMRQILKKLKEESTRRKGEAFAITAGEILMDSQVEASFSIQERDAETRVSTAVSWLERGGYLKREENHTRIFASRPALGREDAEKRLKTATLSARGMAAFRVILDRLYSASADERIHTDQLMAMTDLSSEEVAAILKQMEALGITTNDSQITLFLRHGVKGASSSRLTRTLELEGALFNLLPEQAPDAESGAWQDLNLVPLTTELKNITEKSDLLPAQVLRLLKSLSQDHEAGDRHRTSFELRQINREYFKLRIRDGFTWTQLENFGRRRRMLAEYILAFLVKKLPQGTKGTDLLVETTFGELIRIIEDFSVLSTRIPPDQRRKAVEHVLLYLHRQEILTLNHGLTVMRRAMTIQVNHEKKGPYLKEDYEGLATHYREKRIQVHVMREYVEIALKKMANALKMVLDYFSMPRKQFLNRYFAGRKDILALATSEASWKAITQDLNAAQGEVVTDNNEESNRLVLAGPGSGKTRVVVHRIAYLLRVLRVPSDSVVALTFNRHAATEIRKRLIALVGADAYGVNAMTYHSMAMRLTGTRFGRDAVVDGARLNQVMEEAVALLEGRHQVEGEDDLREKLLRGYRYILVDEYQDIDDLQYRLVSALAGRQAGEEERLCILAVGDDDQNIYAWRDTSNRYIDRFCEDYGAKKSFLIENYRSTKRIIEAANAMIRHNPDRMKAKYPIKIDEAREGEAEGGRWENLDQERRGRVLRITIPASDRGHGNLQAQAVMAELRRLLLLENGDWTGCAILARTHRYLEPMQAWCEQHGIPYFLAADSENALPITRQRDFVAVVDRLREIKEHISADQAFEMAAALLLDPEWKDFFKGAFFELKEEMLDCELSGPALVDWLYDFAREVRRKPKQGLYLGTVHSAKGLEFRHVLLLDGGWGLKSGEMADERRLYYVGMTRAEESLTLCEFAPGLAFAGHLGGDVLSQTFTGNPLADLEKRYQVLSLKDVDLGFAGRFQAFAPVHGALRRLNPGDPLRLKRVEGENRYIILDDKGIAVGRTAKSFSLGLDVEECDVAGILVRYAEDGEESYRAALQCERWEVVVPRIVGRPL